MKITILSLILICFVLVLFTGNFFSKVYASPNLTSGKLSQCPSKPNCVNSEFPDDTDHFFPPLKTTSQNKADTLDNIKQILEKMDATSIDISNSHVTATFTSRIFRFVDDFELRIDEDAKVIHIKSASRTGSSDFGVNRKRAEKFKKIFNETTK